MAVVAMAACLQASQGGGGKSDLDALQGVWRVVSGEMQGQPLPAEEIKEMNGQLTIKGNNVTWKSSKDEDTGTITLDPAKKPKHIDITAKNLGNGKTVKGIYELNGDEFKVCMDPDSSERPSDFKTKEGSGAMVLVFKRAKP